MSSREDRYQYTCPECGHIGAHPKYLPAPKCDKCNYMVVMQKSLNGKIIDEAS